MGGSDLLVNAVFALGAAFLGGLLATQLRQSTMFGFIVGGIAIGPYTPGLVADRAMVEALANIGIVFLLFAVGVQLSVRDLLRAGPVAIVGGSIQVLLTIGLG